MLHAGGGLGEDSAAMNLGLAQQAIAARNPDRECIVTPTRRLTYAQVAERARRLGERPPRERARAATASAPSSRTTSRGRTTSASTCYNCPEYIEGMLGAYLARVAPFNVNYRYVDDELLYLLTDSDATGVIYQARYAPNAGAHPRAAARSCAS